MMNGFIERKFLFALAAVSVFAASQSDSIFVSLWCVAVGAAVLTLVRDFHMYDYSGESWAQNESLEWSQKTLGEIPSDYVTTVSNWRDRFVPDKGFFWWFFRIIYACVGGYLIALGLERIFFGTNRMVDFAFSDIMMFIWGPLIG